MSSQVNEADEVTPARLFGRRRPIHDVLGGGKGLSLSYIFCFGFSFCFLIINGFIP